jgi:hypothetical protein
MKGTSVKSLTSTIRDLGKAQASRGVLPQLAIEVSRAAAEHDINPEDALELYVDYFQASSGLKKIDPFDNSVKANVSKLRQLIKAADPKLMEVVIRQHEKLAKKVEVKPLYHAMVEAARYKSKTGRRPDIAMLAKIVSR